MRMGAERRVGECQVVRKELGKAGGQVCRASRYTTRRNAYYPDFAYRVDGRKKCLQVLSVVGPSKFVQGAQVEAVSCFNKLQEEGDARCIEEYSKQLGYVYSDAPSSTIFFTAIFQYVFRGGNVKWLNPLPFDSGAEDLVLSLARDAREWIDYFQRNISKLKDSPKHTTLSLVLQLDVINCEAFSARRMKMPLEVRFVSEVESQGARKKQRGVRFRSDRWKWVAEYNPPGKKNNKISLGEYDSLTEAARAADAGMFCYGSKTSGYNFADSPSFLQRTPPPVNTQDKEAVRRWARDFANLTAGPSLFENARASNSPSLLRIGNGAPSNSRPPLENSLPPSSSPAESMSNLSSTISNSGASPDVTLHESDCTSAPSLHLEDVTEYIGSLNSLDHQAMLESLDQRAMQINGSLPSDEIPFPEEALFKPNDMDFWNAGSPMCGPEDAVPMASGMVTDDLFQCIMSCNPSCSAEVERCNIQLIR